MKKKGKNKYTYTTAEGRKNSHSRDCAEPKCHGTPPYDGTNEYVCACGEFMPCEGHKCKERKIQ